MENYHIFPYLNNGTKVYLFESPSYLKGFLERNLKSIIKVTLEIGFENYININFDHYKIILKPKSEIDWSEIIEELGFNMCDAYQDFIDAWQNDVSSQDVRVMQMPYEILLILCRKKYDIFGLIDEGIAIDENEFEMDIY